MIINKNLEFSDLNKEVEEVQDPEKAAKIIKRYEDIIKMQSKGIISVEYHQGQVFKRFKEKEKFAKLTRKLEIHKATIIFEINEFKLCKKYPKLLTPSICLGFFKDYQKDIKGIARKMKNIFSVERLYLLKLSL